MSLTITNPPAWALGQDYLDALERLLGFVPCIRHGRAPRGIENSRGNMDFNQHTRLLRRTWKEAPKSGEERKQLKELIYDRYKHRWVEWDNTKQKYVPYYREGQGLNRARGTRQLLMIMIASKLDYDPVATDTLLLSSAEERSTYFVQLPPVGCFIRTATPAFFLSVVAAAAAAATPPPAGALVGGGGAPPAAPGPVPAAATAAAAAAPVGPPPVGPPPVGPPPVGPPAARNAVPAGDNAIRGSSNNNVDGNNTANGNAGVGPGAGLGGGLGGDATGAGLGGVLGGVLGGAFGGGDDDADDGAGGGGLGGGDDDDDSGGDDDAGEGAGGGGGDNDYDDQFNMFDDDDEAMVDNAVVRVGKWVPTVPWNVCLVVFVAVLVARLVFFPHVIEFRPTVNLNGFECRPTPHMMAVGIGQDNLSDDRTPGRNMTDRTTPMDSDLTCDALPPCVVPSQPHTREDVLQLNPTASYASLPRNLSEVSSQQLTRHSEINGSMVVNGGKTKTISMEDGPNHTSTRWVLPSINSGGRVGPGIFLPITDNFTSLLQMGASAIRDGLPSNLPTLSSNYTGGNVSILSLVSRINYRTSNAGTIDEHSILDYCPIRGNRDYPVFDPATVDDDLYDPAPDIFPALSPTPRTCYQTPLAGGIDEHPFLNYRDYPIPGLVYPMFDLASVDDVFHDPSPDIFPVLSSTSRTHYQSSMAELIDEHPFLDYRDYSIPEYLDSPVFDPASADDALHDPNSTNMVLAVFLVVAIFMLAYMCMEKMAMVECIRRLSELFLEQLSINLQRQRKDRRRCQRRRLQSATQSLSNENGNTLTLPSTAVAGAIGEEVVGVGQQQQQQQNQPSIDNARATTIATTVATTNGAAVATTSTPTATATAEGGQQHQASVGNPKKRKRGIWERVKKWHKTHTHTIEGNKKKRKSSHIRNEHAGTVMA